ncbi:hypothetical protein [Haloarchaeobius sp. HME9146]|uniref:hypothetical protein n=1 Tax=Haloarchaeobius sp. HME9146 TaxID=2978732 RepID=UPI0021BEEF77|nr:hypothetical protein [Haloarchaeobius sp. HME9146]MCT9097323.1 hypothetical protein [Haloarchaeobius sp. HME9146]
MSEEKQTRRRTVLRTIGTGIIGSIALAGTGAAGPGNLQWELAEVRSATAEYNDPANALADGYLATDHPVCGMGYHYLNPGLLGTTERTAAQVLAYGEDDEGELVLGAVEFLVPKAGPYSEEPPSYFDYDDGREEWGILEAPSKVPFDYLWALHAWVHTNNPEGVFHHTNPREQFSGEEFCHEGGGGH